MKTDTPSSISTRPVKVAPSKSVPRKKKPTWRKFLPILAGAAFLFFIVKGLSPKPVQVEAVTISRGPLTVSVLEEGKTRVRDRYVVASPVTGVLRRVELEEGDPVEAGKTVLAEIQAGASDFLDPREKLQAEGRVSAADAAVKRQQATLERAQAELELAKKDLARAEELIREGAMARKEWDAADSAVKVKTRDVQAAEFGLRVAEHELAQSKAVLNQGQESAEGAVRSLELHSPVNGSVLDVFQESLRVVTAGTPILEVGDPNDLEIEAEILSQDAVSIRPGSDVIVEAWGGEAPLKGKVRVVEPAAFTKVSALGVEEQRVLVIADFVDPLPSDRKLGDRYRVETRVVTWQSPDVLKIPTGALFRRGNDWMTFVVQSGHAKLRKLEIGHSNGIEAEVKNGLAAGDSVVLHPPDTIADGTAVAPRNSQPGITP